MELLGWGYPVEDSLFMRMARAKVYPITALTGLSRSEKRLLIDHGVIAVDEIMKDRRKLDILHLSVSRVGEILAEADGIFSFNEIARDMVSV